MTVARNETFDEDQAPGAPGILSNWCGGAKQMVGTSLGPSRVWFTIGQGILNEVYYPRIDIAQLRDLGFIIADGRDFWQEIKRLDDCEVECAQVGVPAVTIIHRHPRFVFTQRIVIEPNRDVILIEISLQGDADLKPYVLLAPHLGGTGNHNFAEVGRYRGRPVLWAEQGPFGLALAAVNSQQLNVLGRCSAGYSGTSDGWQDFNQHGHLKMNYLRAGPGNVALTGELTREATLALGFSSSRQSAASLAVSSLLQPFEMIWQQQIDHWLHWHNHCHLPVTKERVEIPRALAEQVRVSAMVLRTHHDQTFRGALVASLSVPWGEHSAERPGYHLVWPRDLVECAGALLALGSEVEAREILRYLMTTQREDGCWYQNQWLGGKPFWTGIQLDQVAFPVLLAGTLSERDALDGIVVTDMVERALGFIARHGPFSPQDRWEENSGVNTFTMAVCLAALVAGADFLPAAEEAFVLELADYWNLRLDGWTAVCDTPFAKAQKVGGYYLRIMPSSALSDESVLMRAMPIKNRKTDPGLRPTEQIGVDFLQLVRYGLRDPDDPLVRDTLKLVDKLLRVELPQGPCWYRYTGDGYGEHADGRAYDGTGHGRLWPLLTGERGHYELVRGADALPYLQAMAEMAGQGGMLPEQVWDKDDIPSHDLFRGQATGSAMPLAWAHAEYIKLACSIMEGQPVDRPHALWSRYHGKRPEVYIWFWLPQTPVQQIPTGARLGFCLPEAADVVWRFDQQKEQILSTHALSLGVHILRLPAPDKSAKKIVFRFQGDYSDTHQYEVVIKP